MDVSYEMQITQPLYGMKEKDDSIRLSSHPQLISSCWFQLSFFSFRLATTDIRVRLGEFRTHKRRGEKGRDPIRDCTSFFPLFQGFFLSPFYIVTRTAAVHCCATE